MNLSGKNEILRLKRMNHELIRDYDTLRKYANEFKYRLMEAESELAILRLRATDNMKRHVLADAVLKKCDGTTYHGLRPGPCPFCAERTAEEKAAMAPHDK